MEKTLKIINSAIEHCQKEKLKEHMKYQPTQEMLKHMKRSIENNPGYTVKLIETITEAITVDQTGKAINEQ